MERDRFRGNHKLYILGLICLVLCLGLIFFSFFILPYLIWQLNYNVPDFILEILNLFQEEYGYSEENSKIVVWLIFFIPGVITGLISYVASNYIDNQLYKSEIQPVDNEEALRNREKKQARRESMVFSLKILGLMILFIFLIFLFQYLIQI